MGRPVDLYPAPPERGVRLMDVREFEQLRDLRQHDRVLYCMGNSEFHGHVYELLRRRPGAVVLHDVLLTGFYRWYAGVERAEDPERALTERIHAMYGDRLPAEAMQDGAPTFERQAALGIYMTRELQSHAEQCFVHSKSAREVLELDRGPLDRQVQVSVLPFGMPRAAEAPRGAAASSPLIVSLGLIHEVNGIATLIDAFALLAVDMPAARLVIAGHAVDRCRVRPLAPLRERACPQCEYRACWRGERGTVRRVAAGGRSGGATATCLQRRGVDGSRGLSRQRPSHDRHRSGLGERIAARCGREGTAQRGAPSAQGSHGEAACRPTASEPRSVGPRSNTRTAVASLESRTPT